MPACPDCGSDTMRKRSGYYVCERCGLTLKPWELQKAQERARAEINEVIDSTVEAGKRKKERDQDNYRRWIEGQGDED